MYLFCANMYIKGGVTMNRIKQLRKEKGLSIDQLSDELKKNNTPISPASISKYEREERNPKIKSWEILANYFNVSVPYLQGLSNNKGNIENKGMSISTVISTIHSIFIYLGRHSETTHIPENIKNGLVFSNNDYITLSDTLTFLLNFVDLNSANYLIQYDKIVKMFSSKVIAKYEKEGMLEKEATKKDVSDILISYCQFTNNYFRSNKTTDDVIDNTIYNLSFTLEQLNMELFNKDEIKRHFVRDKEGCITKIVNEPLDYELPQKVDKATYSKINDVLNNAINELLALRLEKPKSPTFYV